MRELIMTGLFLSMAVTVVVADLDVAALAEAYKIYDTARRDGKGFSESADSSTLGWGEGAVITSYINMWEATGDTYWLTKISEHFHRIMANASDPKGDGYLSWYTAAYSTAAAWAERLHNVSAAEIGPEVQKISKREDAVKCTGHTYLIDFLESARRFRIVDRNTHAVVADGLEHDGTETEVTQIEPFTLIITGQTHQGDRFLVRTKTPEPARYIVHQGLFLYPVARFIETVQARPDLQEQFGAAAEEFLQFINRHVFENSERDWQDMGEMGGAYRSEAIITGRAPNRLIPHNQYAEIARVWLVLEGVKGAHPLIAQRARQMVRYFQSHLYLDEDNDAYYWRYSNWIEYGEPMHHFAPDRYESTGYGNIDVKLAVEAARRGVIFTDEDMGRFVNTWLRVMWNQDKDNPLMASRVDGIGSHQHSPLTTGWAQLSQWDLQAYELALTAFLAQEESKKIPTAPTILLSAARAGRLEKP